VKKTTKTACFEFLPEGILSVTFLSGDDEIDLEEAKIHVNFAKELTNGIKLPVLVDVTQSMHQLTKEAKEYIGNFPFKTAEAILVKELHQRIIASFYLKISRQANKHPTKVFINRDEAITWLLGFKAN